MEIPSSSSSSPCPLGRRHVTPGPSTDALKAAPLLHPPPFSPVVLSAFPSLASSPDLPPCSATMTMSSHHHSNSNNNASLELSLCAPPPVASPPSVAVPPAAVADWNPDALSCLIDCYGQKFSEGRGFVRTKDWESVVDRVNALLLQTPRTLKQCRDKMDGLKRRYKRERRRAIVEGGFAKVSWPFFHSMDLLMNSVLRPPQPSPSPPPPPPPPPLHTTGTTELSSLSLPVKSGSSPEQLEAESLQNQLLPPRHQPFLEPNHHQSRGRVDPAAFLVVNTGPVKKSGTDSRNPSLAQNHRPFKKRPLHTRDGNHTLPGFLQLYANIEHSKAEILSMIELEMATLHKKSRKKSGSGLASTVLS